MKIQMKENTVIVMKILENDLSSIYSTITGKLRFTKNLLSDRFFFHNVFDIVSMKSPIYFSQGYRYH